MKVLVTGGSGFLGVNLINKLSNKNNYEVFSIDKKVLSPKLISNYEAVNDYKLNLNNKNLINLLNALGEQGIAALIIVFAVIFAYRKILK